MIHELSCQKNTCAVRRRRLDSVQKADSKPQHHLPMGALQFITNQNLLFLDYGLALQNEFVIDILVQHTIIDSEISKKISSKINQSSYATIRDILAHWQFHFLQEFKETANKDFLLRGSSVNQLLSSVDPLMGNLSLILLLSINLQTLKKETLLIAAKYPLCFATVTHTLCIDHE